MRKLRTTQTVILLVLISVLLVPGTARPKDPGSKGKDAAKAANAFAIDLYKAVRKPEGNLIFSPYSVSTALAMAYAGARGKTASQMAKSLHLNGEQAKVPQEFRTLNERILSAAKGGTVQINIANALWAEKSFPLRKEYLDSVRISFATPGWFLRLPVVKQVTNVVWDDSESFLRQADFRNDPEAARRTINNWVERQTRDKIKDLFSPGTISPDTRLVLANAIYFKGLWEHQFEKRLTRTRTFHCLDGKEVMVPTMLQAKSCGYAEEPGLQVLEMPYKGGDMSMVILLPSREKPFEEFELSFAPKTLGNWLGRLEKQLVEVYFPRYKVTSGFSLKTPLTGLGMTDAFSTNADFSAMTGKRYLFIGDVIHKAFVQVDEEGTEAAAATGVGILTGLAAKPPPPPIFRADHPFVFLIRHKPTNCILFLGRVTNPEQGTGS